MITNVFRKFLNALYTTAGGTSGGNRTTLIQGKTLAGQTRYVTPFSSSSFPDQVTNSLVLGTSGYGIVLGTGTTAPTGDDYNLAEQITSGISATITTSTEINASDEYVTTYNIVVTNSGSDPVTITEIGRTGGLASASTSGGTYSTAAFLFDRTLLDAPVEIAASGNATIKYTLKADLS